MVPTTDTIKKRPATSRLVTVDISGLCVTRDSADVLVTYSLGSCVALTLFDPEIGVGGMIHCMLPLSTIDPDRARLRPAMFVDSGVDELLAEVYALGAQRERLIAKVAGAGAPLGREETFRIGERNHATLCSVLADHGLSIAAESIGGTAAKSLLLYMNTGETIVKVGGKEIPL